VNSRAAPAIEAIDTDVLIVGAGPAGLYLAFQLGLQDLRVELVDALPYAGGQVAELYADKPIYDIPALPVCTGTELIARLLEQLKPLRPGLHLGQQVARLERQDSGRYLAQTDQGLRFDAAAVVIAAGVGAFVPRRLAVTGLETFEQRQVFHLSLPDAHPVGERLLIVGGDDQALDQAIFWAEAAAAITTTPVPQVTLLYRRASYAASGPRVERVHTLAQQGRLQLSVGQVTGVLADATGQQLCGVQVLDAEGQAVDLALDTLLVCQGLHPKLGPIADWGLPLQRKLLPVDPASMATGVAAIHAIGDIVSYPGKKKLIVCGFHEATLAAFAVALALRPDQPQVLQYTSSSARLQQRLGVAPTA